MKRAPFVGSEGDWRRRTESEGEGHGNKEELRATRNHEFLYNISDSHADIDAQ